MPRRRNNPSAGNPVRGKKDARKQTKPPLRLEWLDAADLADNPRNWRLHPDSQKRALSDVIDKVGWAGALLYNERTKRLIDGHARKEMFTGKGRVPVLVGSWSDEQERLILATLDPLAAMAEANKDALAGLMQGLDGFNGAIGEMLEGLALENRINLGANEPGGGGDEFDCTPQDGPTRAKLGDLWVIGGKHRLLVGDCTVKENVERLMGGEKAGLMNTDPPYGIAYSDADRVAAETAHGRQQRERRWADDAIDNDEVDGEKLQTFLESCIRTAVPNLVDNCAFYLWHPMLTQGTFFAAAAAAADILIHRQIIWCKPGLLFGFGDYHWQHELCFYGWRRGHRPEFYGERNQTTIWDMRVETPSAERGHPTQKPIELFSRPILNHTKPNDLVYEPFAGSGSQFIAAHRLGRRCYGLEIEPRYADVVLKRCEAEGMECEKTN